MPNDRCPMTQFAPHGHAVVAMGGVCVADARHWQPRIRQKTALFRVRRRSSSTASCLPAVTGAYQRHRDHGRIRCRDDGGDHSGILERGRQIQYFHPSPTRPFSAPAGSELDCCSKSTPPYNCRNIESLSDLV